MSDVITNVDVLESRNIGEVKVSWGRTM